MLGFSPFLVNHEDSDVSSIDESNEREPTTLAAQLLRCRELSVAVPFGSIPTRSYKLFDEDLRSQQGIENSNESVRDAVEDDDDIWRGLAQAMADAGPVPDDCSQEKGKKGDCFEAHQLDDSAAHGSLSGPERRHVRAQSKKPLGGSARRDLGVRKI
ncbi:hypothetical protein THAOC_33985 [Thalassiosira oceanica]|uniref:Uncharacterized protein n=1 Tax=Thalassiosira oceanica TaxID=159749 RepID=K0RKW4_THAOC|nr:hypothetical protein THAOC_33985 [Thalassiosira oceanica]|eukprot:EJK47302.1 hypothetical protein THAOC_33985 [Thalassiosira oceanica]